MSVEVLGDPASVGALASTLRRHAAALSHRAGALREAQRVAVDGWVGPVALGHRRRLDGCVSEVEMAADQMTDLAEALEAYGQALTEARHELGRARDEAASAGLVIEDGTAVQGYGITGEADAEAGRERSAAADRVTRRLARTATLLERRRVALARRADEASRSLP